MRKKKGMSMISRDVQRDGAQCECWARTVKGLAEQSGESTFKIATTLVKMNKKQLMSMFEVFSPDCAKRLKKLGGVK